MYLALIRWGRINDNSSWGLKDILPFKEFCASSKNALENSETEKKIPMFAQLWETHFASLISIINNNTREKISAFLYVERVFHWKIFQGTLKQLLAVNRGHFLPEHNLNNIFNCNIKVFVKKQMTGTISIVQKWKHKIAHRFSVVRVQGCHFKPCITYTKTTCESVMRNFFKWNSNFVGLCNNLDSTPNRHAVFVCHVWSACLDMTWHEVTWRDSTRQTWVANVTHF